METKAKIHYYDIGDYLSREDKLNIIKKFGSIARIPWTIIEPNEHGDWINHRNEMFKKFISIEPEKKFNIKSECFFSVNSRGNETGRDVWMYNFSKSQIDDNISILINEYNNNIGKQAINELNYDETKISWTSSLITKVLKKEILQNEHIFAQAIYRPFNKQNTYRGYALIHRVGQFKQIFPTPIHDNLVICVSGIGGTKNFSVLITSCIPDIQLQFNGQCFPLYWYEEKNKPKTHSDGSTDAADMFDTVMKEKEYIRKDGITDWILSAAQKQYGYKVTKEDIFYYVYGILHSPEYRTTFATDLKKSLPRLPLVENADDFWAFSEAGRELAKLHINYETVDPYRKCQVVYAPLTTKGEGMNYRVEKMRFAKKDSKTADKSIIHYNAGITIEDIPAEAYEYVVNSKSAIEWIMERYAVTTDKKSGITNDPNDWAKEHKDEKYILNLLLRIINVSVQTVEIVKGLPKLKFEE